MVASTIHAIGVPFAVATGSGAGLLSVLSWRAFRGSPVGRVVAALAVVMGIAAVYQALLLTAPDATKTTLFGGGKYLAVVGVGALAVDLGRRTGVSLREYNPAVLTIATGAVAFVAGGLAAELLVPALVHWVHGTGALLIVAGFSRASMAESPLDGRFNSVVRDPARHRSREAWMRPIDDRILECCSRSGLVLTPAVIAYNIGYSREEVNRRLSELEARSLVERV